MLSKQSTKDMGTVPHHRKKRRALHLEPHGEGEKSNDRISDLPDTILGEIISLLPTNDGARTQAFATRWRHIWRSAPINLDHNNLVAGEQAHVNLISKIIAEHQGYVHRFVVPAVYLNDYRKVVNTWLQSAALNVLKELKFDPGLVTMPSPHPLLPPSAFRFGATLCIATISMCHIILNMVEMPHFPQLRQLGLESVIISKDSLHNVITRCPVLESLLLKQSYGFDSVSITSNTLVNIGMMGIVKAEVIIKHAPKLEKLLHLERCHNLSISVIFAPKLETLGCLSDCGFYCKLALGTTVIQNLHDISFTSMVCNVKTLSFSIDNLRVGTVINLMRCFPCLQKLYIQISNMSVGSYWCHPEYHDGNGCLGTSLKAITFINYQATKFQINLATFFILNAKVLEIMKFQSRVRNRKMCITEQKRLLQLEKRASVGARFQFLIRKCDYPPHIKHVDDLSKVDPFECTC